MTSQKNYRKSTRWKQYKLGLTISLTHCAICQERMNRIYENGNEPELPEHERCKCFYDWLNSLGVGQATKLGINGADFYLKYYGKLPEYYITKKEAENLGWKSRKGNLDKVAPNKMIGGNIFYNTKKLLPEKSDRIWFECDIDYDGGFRNNERLVYSNDGLIFKTNNHYTEFIAIE